MKPTTVVLAIILFVNTEKVNAQMGILDGKFKASKMFHKKDARKKKKHHIFSPGKVYFNTASNKYTINPGGWKKPKKGNYWNVKSWNKPKLKRKYRGRRCGKIKRRLKM